MRIDSKAAELTSNNHTDTQLYIYIYIYISVEIWTTACSHCQFSDISVMFDI